MSYKVQLKRMWRSYHRYTTRDTWCMKCYTVLTVIGTFDSKKTGNMMTIYAAMPKFFGGDTC